MIYFFIFRVYFFISIISSFEFKIFLSDKLDGRILGLYILALSFKESLFLLLFLFLTNIIFFSKSKVNKLFIKDILYNVSAKDDAIMLKNEKKIP